MQRVFPEASEEERTHVRRAPLKCRRLLQASKPLAARLAQEPGLFTRLNEEEMESLLGFHCIWYAFLGSPDLTWFPELYTWAGLSGKDIELLEQCVHNLSSGGSPDEPGSATKADE